MLTRETLDKFKSGTIFASGLVFDTEDGINFRNTGELLRWAAVRGGVDDWAVYVYQATKDAEWIKEHGCKLSKREAIKLVLGTEDFYDRYRR